MLRFHIFISGRVQLVGFRSFLRKKASELGINGWVKNLDDGRVEAIFEGEDSKVNEILDHCKKGPFLAKVENLIVKEEEEYKNEFKNFEIRF